MITLNIKFSLEYENHRVQGVLKKLQWFKENGYDVGLPQGLSPMADESTISDAVSREYVESEYEKYSQMIKNKWQDYISKIETVGRDLPFQLKNEYTIFLTKYGTAGSYFAEEAKIVVNMIKRDEASVLGTVIHEITHIGIEYLIQKYNVSHWKKERLVDLICEKYFSDLRQLRVITEDVSSVDEAFSALYPDIEKIVQKIGA
jgi:hypothetical protein